MNDILKVWHLKSLSKNLVDNKEVNRILTPAPEEQTLLILSGQCPHNKGWAYYAHDGNGDAHYECKICGKLSTIYGKQSC